MKVRELMTSPAISVAVGESVDVAARTLTQYNIGALPVCRSDGTLCGMVTDRDLVTRCMAAGRHAGSMKVREVMTSRVVSAGPDMEVALAASLMGRERVRRLPVLENGKLCGMVSLGDLAGREESVMEAADALTEISGNITVK